MVCTISELIIITNFCERLTPPPNTDFLLLPPLFPPGTCEGEEGKGEPEPDPAPRGVMCLLLEVLARLLWETDME